MGGSDPKLGGTGGSQKEIPGLKVPNGEEGDDPPSVESSDIHRYNKGKVKAKLQKHGHDLQSHNIQISKPNS